MINEAAWAGVVGIARELIELRKALHEYVQLDGEVDRLRFTGQSIEGALTYKQAARERLLALLVKQNTPPDA
jgi:hypothetical protein